jgi:hypothetical protein
MTRYQLAGAAAALAAAALVLWLGALRHPEVPFLTRERGGDWITPAAPLSTKTHRIPPETPKTVVFHRSFEASGQASMGALRVNALGIVQLRLNGKRIRLAGAAGEGRCWKQGCRLEVPLARGTNRVSVGVRHIAGPPLLFFELRAPTVHVASDTSWQARVDGGPPRAVMVADDTRVFPPTGAEPRPMEAAGRRGGELIALSALSLLLLLAARREPLRARLARRLPEAALALTTIFWLVFFLAKFGHIRLAMGFDGFGHVEYVRFLLHNWRLPGAGDGWSMYNPPFFYLLTSAVTAVVDPAPVTAAERLSMRSVGFLSGLGNVWTAYFLARRVFPTDSTSRAFAVLVAGFLPLNLYMSAYVSTDATHAFLIGLAVLVAGRLLSTHEIRGRDLVLLGSILGLAALTKFTALLLIPVVCFFVAWRVCFVDGGGGLRIGGVVGGVLLVAVVVGGWFYLRNWVIFGDPFVWNLDTPGLTSWWLEPGFRTGRYYLLFGESLRQPYFACFHSLWDGIYSTLWGDGMVAGRTAFRARNLVWNYDYMSITYLFALPALAFGLLGFLLTVRRALIDADPSVRCVSMLLVSLIFTMGAGMVWASLRYPFWGSPKASYALALVVPVAIASARGLGAFTAWCSAGRRRLLLIPFCAWLGTFVGVVTLSYVG